MARTIDEHTGSTSMGCFIICLNVNADVALTEDENNNFYFFVSYNYSGTKSGSGQTTLGPITGNKSGSQPEPDDVEIDYQLTNWSVTETTVSCNLTVSISHNSFPNMGPDYIFQNQQFQGQRLAVQVQNNQDRMAKFQAMDEALHKATGVSCAKVYS